MVVVSVVMLTWWCWYHVNGGGVGSDVNGMVSVVMLMVMVSVVMLMVVVSVVMLMVMVPVPC